MSKFYLLMLFPLFVACKESRPIEGAQSSSEKTAGSQTEEKATSQAEKATMPLSVKTKKNTSNTAVDRMGIGPKYDLKKESIEITKLWEAPMWTQKTVNLSSFNYNTMVTSFGDDTYLVYVDDQRRPKVVKMGEDKQVSSAWLDKDEKDVYRSLNDGHHSFSIGVDELGYIHISGDMHGYPSKGAVKHLPDRYNPLKKKGYCMYWRSARPGDIENFVWLGGDKVKSPQGEYFSYMAFVNDNKGRLYYYSRQRRSDPRQMLWVSSKYDTQSGSWAFIGGTEGSPYKMPLTIWELGGENDNHYVRSQGWVYFDRNDRMHLVSTVIEGRPNKSRDSHWVTDCVYAVSDDYGNTAHKMDATPIVWPARKKAGPNQGDIVHTKHFMQTPVSLAVDRENNPVVLLKSGSSFLKYWDLKQKKWLQNDIHGKKVFNDSQGVITVLNGREIKRLWHAGDQPVIHQLKHRVHLIDRQYLRRTGNFKGLAREGNKLVLLHIKIKRPVAP